MSGRSSNSWLHEHMRRERGRTGAETHGLPLEGRHHFEHVEQALGLTDLGHHHAAEAGTEPRFSVERDDAAITAVT